jgi:hypothetical protein
MLQKTCSCDVGAPPVGLTTHFFIEPVYASYYLRSDEEGLERQQQNGTGHSLKNV